MLRSGVAQLARFHNLPSRGITGCTEAKLHDMRPGYETALNLFLTILSGTNYISYAAGGLESSLSISYEKLITDNEIIGSNWRAAKGIEVTPENTTLDLIKGVGWRGDFLRNPTPCGILETRYFKRRLQTLRHSRFGRSKGDKILERGPGRWQIGLLRDIKPSR